MFVGEENVRSKVSIRTGTIIAIEREVFRRNPVLRKGHIARTATTEKEGSVSEGELLRCFLDYRTHHSESALYKGH